MTYGNNVEEANDNGENARCEEQTPEWHAQGLLASGLFVHVAEHVESDNHHGASKRDESMCRAQQRPVASEEIAEK